MERFIHIVHIIDNICIYEKYDINKTTLDSILYRLLYLLQFKNSTIYGIKSGKLVLELFKNGQINIHDLQIFAGHSVEDKKIKKNLIESKLLDSFKYIYLCNYYSFYDGYDYVLYQYILSSRIKDPNYLCGVIPFNVLHKVYLEEYEN